MQKIAIASDHAGFDMKNHIIKALEQCGYKFKDFGPFSPDSVDYPEYAHPLAAAVETGEFELGILLCGSGNGMSMAANKHKGIRCAVCWNIEISRLARQHNNANICSLPARFITNEQAIEIVKTFFAGKFEGGRHVERVRNIPGISD